MSAPDERYLRASMGPHSFKCGKPAVRVTPAPLYVGFNGAALFQVRKERRGGDLDGLLVLCFNGAALFQVRKGSTFRHPDEHWNGFNGAALFQVRKVAQAHERQRIGEVSFNGAALFQVRKETNRRYRPSGICKRFNGAALFQVRKAALLALALMF